MWCLVLVFTTISMLQFGKTEGRHDDLSNDLLDAICRVRQPNYKHDKGQDSSHSPKPAFTASLSVQKTFSSTVPIKFDTVWLNIGNIYDPSTGIFTVPRKGLYMVSGSVMSVSGKLLHCHLWKNDNMDVGVFGTNWSQGAFTIMMELKKGDKLAIRNDRNGEPVNGFDWSIFSAHLVSE